MALLRHALADDAPRLLSLIKEFAQLMTGEDVVTTTEKDLLKAGWGENPRFGCYVVETSDGDLEGYTLFSWNYSTWRGHQIVYLDDLYVRAHARGHGYGRMLLSAVARHALDDGDGRLTLHAFTWNPAQAFYESLGFSREDESVRFAIEGRALRDLAARDSAPPYRGRS